ncbi:MAG: hypothetical protein N3F05_01455 [Candidatus Diapherotrites archaeon]|nr:hypothetical protein [Candidatus Diapherotrites archaeon]
MIKMVSSCKHSYLILILFVLIYPNISLAQQPADPYYLLRIDSTLQKPTVAYPGNSVNLAITLENIGLYTTAENIKLQLLFPAQFKRGAVEQIVDAIKPKEKKTVVFVFDTPRDLPSGTYTLTLFMKYKSGIIDINDNRYINLLISDIYDVSISNVRSSNYFPHIGDKIVISADIVNAGSLEARNVYAELSILGANTAPGFILQSDMRQELGNMTVGESKKIAFEITASEASKPGTYAFKLSAGCRDCETKTQIFSIHLYGRPDIIISGIDYSISGRDDKKIMQGDNISLAVQLDNLGKESAKKVIVNIENDSSLVGSKSAYIGEIKSEDSGSAIFDLSVDKNATIGYHEIKITITYLDEMQKEQKLHTAYSVYVAAAPEPSQYMHYVFIIIILVLVYIIIKLIIRQLALRKL